MLSQCHHPNVKSKTISCGPTVSRIEWCCVDCGIEFIEKGRLNAAIMDYEYQISYIIEAIEQRAESMRNKWVQPPKDRIQFPEMPLNPASCPYHCRDSSGPYCTKNGTENRAVCTLETHNEYCEEPRRRMSQTPPESCAHVVRGDRGEWCCGITSLYTVCSVLCGHYRRKT